MLVNLSTLYPLCHLYHYPKCKSLSYLPVHSFYSKNFLCLLDSKSMIPPMTLNCVQGDPSSNSKQFAFIFNFVVHIGVFMSTQMIFQLSSLLSGDFGNSSDFHLHYTLATLFSNLTELSSIKFLSL